MANETQRWKQFRARARSRAKVLAKLCGAKWEVARGNSNYRFETDLA